MTLPLEKSERNWLTPQEFHQKWVTPLRIPCNFQILYLKNSEFFCSFPLGKPVFFTLPHRKSTIFPLPMSNSTVPKQGGGGGHICNSPMRTMETTLSPNKKSVVSKNIHPSPRIVVWFEPGISSLASYFLLKILAIETPSRYGHFLKHTISKSLGSKNFTHKKRLNVLK